MDRSGVRRMLIIKAVSLCVSLVAYFVLRRRLRKRRRLEISYGPMLERDERRIKYLRDLYGLGDKNCVAMLRMKVEPFMKLCDKLRTRGLLVDSIHTSVEEQVAMFLHVVGHNQRFRVIGVTFKRSNETIHRYFKQILRVIGELRDECIRPPSMDTHPKILESSRWNPYFKDCIGAIDGTHVIANVPRDQVQAFRGRYKDPTQNVLAAVDFDLRFTYVLAGWEGSAHDQLILSDAIQRQNGLRVPQGKFYLVDAGYAARPGFLPPFRATRYHLREWGRRRPESAKELFNLRHSSLRVTVERAFGALKNRWKMLKCYPFHPYKTQVDLVLACCILHNWILGYGVDDYFPTEEAWVPNQSRSAQEQREDNRTWSEMRDAMANEMWANREENRII